MDIMCGYSGMYNILYSFEIHEARNDKFYCTFFWISVEKVICISSSIDDNY